MSGGAEPTPKTAIRGSAAGEVLAAFLRLGLTSFGGPIAHLGYFDFPDLFSVIAQLEIILNANGHPVPYGAGVAAVQNVYAEAAIKKEAVTA